jgi:hypothetical protein
VGKLDGDECGDVGDGERVPGDKFVIGELPIKQRKEPTQGLLSPLDQGGDLGNAALHAGQAPVLEHRQRVSHRL